MNESLGSRLNRRLQEVGSFGSCMSKDSLSVIRRVFLVGCPRSGTTLLQSLLAAHPEVKSFPESHFFERLTPTRPLFRRLGIASRRAGPALEALLEGLELSAYRDRFPRRALFARRFARPFVRMLDEVTLASGRRVWLEKTPGHVRVIEEITAAVPKAKFIHLIRHGPHTIASLFDVAQRYPDTWGTSNSIEKCIRRWIKDVRLSLAYENVPNHRIVRYEELVHDPENVLGELCDFLAVPAQVMEMIDGYPQAARVVIGRHEPWKSSVGTGLKDLGEEKYNRLFSPEQRAFIERGVGEAGLDQW